MSQNNWEVVTPHTCLLGEGPVWDNGHKRILWVDILNGEVHCFYPHTNEHRMCKTAQMIGAIAVKRSGGIIAAVKGGFASIDLDSGALNFIAAVENHLPGNRFNDGKCDPAGRFWAGTMSPSDRPMEGALYFLEKDGSVKTKLTGITCSNGIAWNPDLTTMYYIDTPTRNVVAYDYEILNGNISNSSVAITIAKETGYPDGMTIDSEGMLWIALWDGGKVARYDPYSGKQLHEIILPVSRPTSCVFGGDGLEDLYITSAKEGLTEDELKKQPLAGSLFVVKNCGFKGLEAFEYAG